MFLRLLRRRLRAINYNVIKLSNGTSVKIKMYRYTIDLYSLEFATNYNYTKNKRPAICGLRTAEIKLFEDQCVQLVLIISADLSGVRPFHCRLQRFQLALCIGWQEMLEPRGTRPKRAA